MSIAVAIALWVLLLPPYAYGTGFGVFVHGATSMGEGLTAIAHGSNPEVIAYNPALILQLPGDQLTFGSTIIFPNNSYRSASSGREQLSDSGPFYPSHLYFTRALSERMSVGIGLFSPFGLGTEWDAHWEGRYLTTTAEMKSLNLRPIIAYRLTPEVGMSAGLDLLHVDTRLANRLNFSALGLADGEQVYHGQGSGVGFTLGLTAALSDTLDLGLAYRSGVKVDLSGDLEFELPDQTLADSFPDTEGEVSIDFPAQLSAALAYRGWERFILEAGVRWEGWSSYDQLQLELNRPVAGMDRIARPAEWNDTLTFTLGGRYYLADNLALLAGYVRGEDPIPDDRFEPSVVDATSQAITLGMEFTRKPHRFALSYSYQHWDSRKKENAIGVGLEGGSVDDATANGEYRSHFQFLSSSYTYLF